jgi:flagellar biosynthetic protein FliO
MNSEGSFILKSWVFLFVLCGTLIVAEANTNSCYAQALDNKQDLNKLDNLTSLPPVDLGASVLAMFKGLAICILILMLGVWLLKKFKSPLISPSIRKLKVIDRLPLTARSSLVLVQVNQKQVLVGVSADRINLISDFVESDSVDLNTKETSAGSGGDRTGTDISVNENSKSEKS